MACLVARLQPRGPGVKSFLSGVLAYSLFRIRFFHYDPFCMRMSSFWAGSFTFSSLVLSKLIQLSIHVFSGLLDVR